MDNKYEGNIDIRMANYLTVVSNPEKYSFYYDSETFNNMRKALKIYYATTSRDYVQEYTRAEVAERTRSAFK
jgi:hypothetical protein